VTSEITRPKQSIVGVLLVVAGLAQPPQMFGGLFGPNVGFRVAIFDSSWMYSSPPQLGPQPAHFIMERKMLLTLKRLAETNARTTHAGG